MRTPRKIISQSRPTATRHLPHPKESSLLPLGVLLLSTTSSIAFPLTQCTSSGWLAVYLSVCAILWLDDFPIANIAEMELGREVQRPREYIEHRISLPAAPPDDETRHTPTLCVCFWSFLLCNCLHSIPHSSSRTMKGSSFTIIPNLHPFSLARPHSPTTAS